MAEAVASVSAWLWVLNWLLTLSLAYFIQREAMPKPQPMSQGDSHYPPGKLDLIVGWLTFSPDK
jgi:hypothetical protein